MDNIEIHGFEMLEKLGEGATSIVYKALQKSMDRIVAIKVLSPSLAKDENFQEHFLAEARASARLSHRNIIQGIDVGKTSQGVFYFVMEHVDGITALELTKEKPPEEEVVSIILQIAKALEHAHQHKMVHKDIKPENIMITKDKVAKLCDLGLAVKKGDANSPVGTPYYISPEQAEGKEIDIRSDIYSLGVSAYHMATTKVPFGGAPMVVMSKHMTKPVPHPRLVNSSLSEEFCHVIMKMLEKNPNLRYHSPTELVEALENYTTVASNEEIVEDDSKKGNRDLKKLGLKLKKKKKRRRF